VNERRNPAAEAAQAAVGIIAFFVIPAIFILLLIKDLT
jgi:hypothetical protein